MGQRISEEISKPSTNNIHTRRSNINLMWSQIVSADLMVNIFSFLTFIDIFKCRRVCNYWNQLCSDLMYLEKFGFCNSNFEVGDKVEAIDKLYPTYGICV